MYTAHKSADLLEDFPLDMDPWRVVRSSFTSFRVGASIDLVPFVAFVLEEPKSLQKMKSNFTVETQWEQILLFAALSCVKHSCIHFLARRLDWKKYLRI